MSWLKSQALAHLLMMSISVGCHATPPATRPVNVATTQPLETTITLDSAVLSNQLEQGDWELDMQSQLSFDANTVLVGQIATYDDDDKTIATIPVIGYRQDGRTFALKIEGNRLVNAGWSYISAGPSKNEFWGVLDASLDGKQPDLVLVHSVDGGHTIKLSSLHKPLADCVFDSFCMDHDGHGRISVYVDRTKARPRKAGYYHFRTNDDGQTWSTAELEHDAMTPAGDVPADTTKVDEKPSRV